MESFTPFPWPYLPSAFYSSKARELLVLGKPCLPPITWGSLILAFQEFWRLLESASCKNTLVWSQQRFVHWIGFFLFCRPRRNAAWFSNIFIRGFNKLILTIRPTEIINVSLISITCTCYLLVHVSAADRIDYHLTISSDTNLITRAWFDNRKPTRCFLRWNILCV